MDHQDRQAIEQLFGKISQVERQSTAPDAQAADFIRSRIDQQPNAPYYMAQTIVVQEQALSAAHGRIQQLEHELANRRAGGGGFLSGLFGGGAPQQRRAAAQRDAATGAAYRSLGSGLTMQKRIAVVAGMILCPLSGQAADCKLERQPSGPGSRRSISSCGAHTTATISGPRSRCAALGRPSRFGPMSIGAAGQA
ncbi:DUF2076 domain-containing protein [Microvirga zambiensis]|uniref:DUF2076 domain-containing protein n=1 Tax=Microvirga zambiensis TaxID=1402137 RepID=UPI001FE7C995|nr:DUF2076 family protein [Microvirga zambiensis]